MDAFAVYLAIGHFNPTLIGFDNFATTLPFLVTKTSSVAAIRRYFLKFFFSSISVIDISFLLSKLSLINLHHLRMMFSRNSYVSI